MWWTWNCWVPVEEVDPVTIWHCARGNLCSHFFSSIWDRSCVGQVDFDLKIILPQPLKCWCSRSPSSFLAFHPEHVYWEGSYSGARSSQFCILHQERSVSFAFPSVGWQGREQLTHKTLAQCAWLKTLETVAAASALHVLEVGTGPLHQCFFLCVLLCLERRSFLRGMLIEGHHWFRDQQVVQNNVYSF